MVIADPTQNRDEEDGGLELSHDDEATIPVEVIGYFGDKEPCCNCKSCQ